jgi:hypothetical protein
MKSFQAGEQVEQRSKLEALCSLALLQLEPVCTPVIPLRFPSAIFTFLFTEILVRWLEVNYPQARHTYHRDQGTITRHDMAPLAAGDPRIGCWDVGEKGGTPWVSTCSIKGTGSGRSAHLTRGNLRKLVCCISDCMSQKALVIVLFSRAICG